MTTPGHDALAPPEPGGPSPALAASSCDRCGFFQLADRRCDRCLGETRRRAVAASGTVLAATVVERAPDDVLLEAPFAVALVALAAGPQLLAVAAGRVRFEPGQPVAVREELVERSGISVVAHVVRAAGSRGGDAA